jgi:hypothetical protein
MSLLYYILCAPLLLAAIGLLCWTAIEMLLSKERRFYFLAICLFWSAGLLISLFVEVTRKVLA